MQENNNASSSPPSSSNTTTENIKTSKKTRLEGSRARLRRKVREALRARNPEPAQRVQATV
eukprot:2088393-Rhodomonas_salina.1